MTTETSRGERRSRAERARPARMVVDATDGIGRPVVASDVPSPLAGYLARSHERHRRAFDGAVATYIPELGRADPAWFGIAAVTVDGRRHGVGDVMRPFTIQSISKPLTYGLVLEALGEDAVRARIGVEPTGEAFNSIALAADTGMPLNPMVNAGAIAAAGLVPDPDGRGSLRHLLEGYGRFAGRPLGIDDGVLDSERSSGHRNRAIGQLLRASGAIDGDADAVVDRYFAQCSVSVTAADLAVVAATLANGGRNPVTGDRAISESTTQSVLAVMASCGMYDGAGEWWYSVGLPAKSGVSGGILVVVPGRLGIAVFSPPLDASGNSVRGVRVCRDLVRDLGLHPLRDDGHRPSAIRTIYRLSEVGSKRRRTPAQRAALADAGRRGLVIELQGAISYLGPDELGQAVDAARASAGAVDLLVIDLHRVERVDAAAIELFGGLVAGLAREGIEVIVSGRYRVATEVAALARSVARLGGGPLRTTDDRDAALEEAEDHLLAGTTDGVASSVMLAEQALVRGLDGPARAVVATHLERQRHPAGSTIVRRGAPARELYLIEGGRASVTIDVPGAGTRRLATLGPGMSFGESALLDEDRRTADVRADTDVTCLVLSVAAFDELLRDHPAVAATLLRNLLRSVGETAGRLTREVAVLAG